MVKNFRSQQGFVTLGVAIGLLFLTLISAGAIVVMREQVQEAQYRSQGDLMKTLGNGGNSLIVANYDKYLNNQAIPGIAVPTAPTVAELKALGLLPNGFSDSSLFSPSQLYKISIAKKPAGCVAPACDIEGLVYLSTPITDPSTGNVRGGALGTAIGQIGGDGGYSDENAPNTIYGFGGQWNVPNLAGNVAGILAMRIGYGSGGFAAFTRRDGTAPPTNDWDFNAKNISNLGTIQLSTVTTVDTACTPNGTVSRDASGAVLSCQSGFWRLLGSRFWKDPVSTFGALPFTDAVGTVRLTLDTGRAFSWTGGAWIPLAVDQNGNLTVPGTVSTGKVALNDIVTEGGGCAPNGLLSRDSTGLILSCKDGIWVAGSGPILYGGSFLQRYNGAGTVYQGCIQANAVTGGCSCPVGYNYHWIGYGQLSDQAPFDVTTLGYACEKGR